MKCTHASVVIIRVWECACVEDGSRIARRNLYAQTREAGTAGGLANDEKRKGPGKSTSRLHFR